MHDLLTMQVYALPLERSTETPNRQRSSTFKIDDSRTTREVSSFILEATTGFPSTIATNELLVQTFSGHDFVIRFSSEGDSVVHNVPFGEVTTSNQSQSLTRLSDVLQPIRSMMQKAKLLDKEAKPREAGIALMTYIEESFRSGRLDSVNWLLTEFRPEEWSEASVLGVVRSSARARKKLPAWHGVFQRAKNEIKRRGRNADGLFIGLE